MTTYQNEPCPSCSSQDTAEIVFGFPGEIHLIQAELDRGEKVLGGCDVSKDSPRYQCNICKNEWGESEWKTILEDSEKCRIEKYNNKEREAIKRGDFEVVPNKNGYVQCPHCNMKFSINHDMSWDGIMHKSCHTRLTIKMQNKAQ